MIIKILYPEDTKPYLNYFPIYAGKEEIIQKATEYLTYEEIRELVEYLNTFDIENFKQRKFNLQVGDFGFESWEV